MVWLPTVWTWLSIYWMDIYDDDDDCEIEIENWKEKKKCFQQLLYIQMKHFIFFPHFELQIDIKLLMLFLFAKNKNSVHWNKVEFRFIK